MTTLTLDKLLETIESFGPAPARVPSLGWLPQMPVFESNYLPAERLPFWLIMPAHPLIVWFAKFLPISPWVWYPTSTQGREYAYLFGGNVFMSPRMAGVLRAEITS